MTGRIVPNLWFDDQAEEAAEFYVSVFPSSRIEHVARFPEDAYGGEAGSVMTVAVELDGNPFVLINGGPAHWGFTEAVSFQITCAGQEEVDHYWERLTDGGEESRCGWLKDRYGLSWQVVPAGLQELLSDPDGARRSRAMQAMLGMGKLDLEAMRRAADGVPT